MVTKGPLPSSSRDDGAALPIGGKKDYDSDVEGGPDGDGSNVDLVGPEQFGSSFSDKVIRARFIRKVYAILLSQLTLTLAIVSVVIFTPAIKGFYCDGHVFRDDNGFLRCGRVGQNGFILYIVSYVIFIVTYIALVCCESVRKRSPGNLFAMGIFTIALSMMSASIAVYHDVAWVVMAIGITALLCLGLTLFSFQTKIDVTGMGMYLFAASWVLFLFGIISIVFLAKSYPITYSIYSGLVAFLFSMFLVYDTQQIMGGKKYSISPEEHVYAAVQLYVDVVMIFLSLLNLGRR